MYRRQHDLGGSNVNITFYGVRGSTPCSSEANARYGGNTSSVVVEAPDTPPILLDLGTGLTEPLARFALERADQAVLVTTPDWIASSTVLDALDYVLLRLGGHQVTMATNKVSLTRTPVPQGFEAKLRRHRIARRVEIPEDERLRSMLDQGTYVCEQLDRCTRHAVKRLGLAVAEQLV